MMVWLKGNFPVHLDWAAIGDSFGPMNALVSALVFGSLIVSLWYQRKDLTDSVKSQRTTAGALKDQLNLMSSTNATRKIMEREEATLDYLLKRADMLRVDDKFNFKRENNGVETYSGANLQVERETQEILTAYEHLAAGVNSGHFDIETVNNAHGRRLLENLTSLNRYIRAARRANVSRYGEINLLATRILEMRLSYYHLDEKVKDQYCEILRVQSDNLLPVMNTVFHSREGFKAALIRARVRHPNLLLGLARRPLVGVCERPSKECDGVPPLPAHNFEADVLALVVYSGARETLIGYARFSKLPPGLPEEYQKLEDRAVLAELTTENEGRKLEAGARRFLLRRSIDAIQDRDSIGSIGESNSSRVAVVVVPTEWKNICDSEGGLQLREGAGYITFLM